jgi:hypothetical protein
LIPEIKKNILDNVQYHTLKNAIKSYLDISNIPFDECGRKCISDITMPLLKEYSEILMPMAKNFFNSNTLVPSYTLFTEYSDTNINLHKHKDANACTYTIDLVLYQNKPWGLWIDGVEYLANENEAIFFWGEDQLHWRETIENNNNIVGVIFFHYVEPDHWLFTKGPEHRQVIIEGYRNEPWFPK